MTVGSDFGDAAIAARKLIIEENMSPRDAWLKACKANLSRPVYWVKPCPRSVFLTLCSEGLVKGVSSGTYSNARENRDHTLKALEFLVQDKSLLLDKRKWWSLVVSDNPIVYDYQLDVIIALSRTELLNL